MPSQLPDLSTICSYRVDYRQLSTYILLQASLLSNVRSNPDQPALFHYSNLQHLRDYHPRLSELPGVNVPQISMRLAQILARILTHIAPETSEGAEEHAINSSFIFDARSIIWETSTACKGFIDLLYDRSDQAHFVGSFVDAYDIFISGVFYIHLEQPQFLGVGSHWSTGDVDGARGGRLGNANDVVNKCCTLIAGIESRFAAVKVFRRVLRDFFAFATGQYHPESTNPVR